MELAYLLHERLLDILESDAADCASSKASGRVELGPSVKNCLGSSISMTERRAKSAARFSNQLKLAKLQHLLRKKVIVSDATTGSIIEVNESEKTSMPQKTATGVPTSKSASRRVVTQP